jgi:hypothetical protein
MVIIPITHAPKAQPVTDEPRDFCRTMQRNADGSWAATAPISIELPNGGKVRLDATTVRERTIVINGIDVARFLDERCGSQAR